MIVDHLQIRAQVTAMSSVTDFVKVDGVVSRADTNVPDDYLPWAETFLKIMVDPAASQDIRPNDPSWQQLEYKRNTRRSYLGDRTLFVTHYKRGWIVELNWEVNGSTSAYILNLTRVLNIVGVKPLLAAMRA